MRTIGQRRVEETLVGATEAAELLGIEPEELPKLMRKHGIKPQKIRVAEREAIVYGLADVAVDGAADSPVRDLIIGTTTIADLLGKPPANVVKMLDRRKLEKQMVTVGRRNMAVYLRDDVERVRRQEEKRLAARA